MEQAKLEMTQSRYELETESFVEMVAREIEQLNNRSELAADRSSQMIMAEQRKHTT